MKQYRQGDVLIEKISINTIPSDVNRKEDNLIVVGEAMNHGHYATGDVELLIESNPTDMSLGYLVVNSSGKIEHLNVESKTWTQEHKEIELEQGVYHLIQQRQFDPFANAVIKNRD